MLFHGGNCLVPRRLARGGSGTKVDLSEASLRFYFTSDRRADESKWGRIPLAILVNTLGAPRSPSFSHLFFPRAISFSG